MHKELLSRLALLKDKDYDEVSRVAQKLTDKRLESFEQELLDLVRETFGYQINTDDDEVLAVVYRMGDESFTYNLTITSLQEQSNITEEQAKEFVAVYLNTIHDELNSFAVERIHHYIQKYLGTDNNDK